MNPSDYLRLSIGGFAALTSLSFNQWAAGFCAVIVGLVTLARFILDERRARQEKDQTKPKQD